jgi:hypothetical protein
MLEERAKARAAANLEEHALACFEVDRQGAIKKIQDVNFDPLPNIFTSEVKTYQSPLGSSVMCDEFTKIIHELLEVPITKEFNKLMDSYKRREEKNLNLLFFLMMLLFAY